MSKPLTEEGQLRRRLGKATLMLVGLFMFTAIEGIALWHAGRYWEQAYWTTAECMIPAALWLVAGLVNLNRVKKQVLPAKSTLTSIDQLETTEGKP